MAIEYFLCYHSFLDAIEPLNDAERGRLFTALLEYSMTGATADLRGNERFLFPALRSQIDRDKQSYADKCKAQSANAQKRWDAKNATASDGINGNANDANDAKTKEKTKTKAKEKAKTKENDIFIHSFLEKTSAREAFDGIGKGVVLLSDEQMEDLLTKLSLEEFDRYVGIVADQELKGHAYTKPHYVAILEMALHDRSLR